MRIVVAADGAPEKHSYPEQLNVQNVDGVLIMPFWKCSKCGKVSLIPDTDGQCYSGTYSPRVLWADDLVRWSDELAGD